MKKWLIVALFLVAVFLDGIIFPAFFGFREGFLTIVFVVTLLLYHGVSLRGLIFGIVFSGLTEFYWGLKLGTLVLPLLASAGVFFLLNTFFDIRNKILMIILGLIMFTVFWETSILVNKIL